MSAKQHQFFCFEVHNTSR